MSQFRPTFFIPLFAFLGLAIIGGLALQGTVSGSRNPNQLPSVLIGKPAPDVPLPLLQNNQAELALDAYRGQPLLINFFASWCAPCRAEAPALEHLSKKISIIGITYKDRPQDARKFLQKYAETIMMTLQSKPIAIILISTKRSKPRTPSSAAPLITFVFHLNCVAPRSGIFYWYSIVFVVRCLSFITTTGNRYSVPN